MDGQGDTGTEIAFNSGELLGIFVKKFLKSKVERARRPHSRDWERVTLKLTGQEGEPPRLPCILKSTEDKDPRGDGEGGENGRKGKGGVQRFDGGEPEWEIYVELYNRNVPTLEEQLRRAEEIGLRDINIAKAQIEAAQAVILGKIGLIKKKLDKDERQIKIESRGLTTSLLRALELVLTWAEVDPGSEEWTYDKDLITELEKGGWLCAGCGELQHPEGDSTCNCLDERRRPKGRGRSLPRLSL